MSDIAYLRTLEAESVYIFREIAAQFERPALLFSIGKDSCVLLHLAMKAFYPAKPPFPLLHVDTSWKFQEMISFRDRRAAELGLDLIVHRNEEALAQGVNPFTHGSQVHTDLLKTQGLRQALEKYGFDAAIGGARRDEEASRAKERIFSFRSAAHRWDPRQQRPELWSLYNGRKRGGESFRVFPISNWTEMDVWRYIQAEDIPLVSLYFAKPRPVVQHQGMMIMADDDRIRAHVPEQPVMRTIRFRTLGCYPLTGGLESQATSVASVIREMEGSRLSERQGRLIDRDQPGSMERKKQEGYF